MIAYYFKYFRKPALPQSITIPNKKDNTKMLTENPWWLESDSDILVDIPKMQSDTYIPTYHQNLSAPSIPKLNKEKSVLACKKNLPTEAENNILNNHHNTHTTIDIVIN